MTNGLEREKIRIACLALALLGCGGGGGGGSGGAGGSLPGVGGAGAGGRTPTGTLASGIGGAVGSIDAGPGAGGVADTMGGQDSSTSVSVDGATADATMGSDVPLPTADAMEGQDSSPSFAVEVASADATLGPDVALPTADAKSPSDATGRTTVVKISAGENISCAVMSDGSVMCLRNYTRNLTHFEALAGIHNAVDIVVSGDDSVRCAVLADGTVKCWGKDDKGQLGDGNLVDSDTPVSVVGINTAKGVTAGQDFACALLADGTVKCWGSNGYGQMGNGSWVSAGFGGAMSGPDTCGQANSPCARTPVTVPGIGNAVQISAGAVFMCAVLADSTVKCWGGNIAGALATGSDVGPISGTAISLSIAPVAVAGLTNVAAVKAEWYHLCTVLKDGGLRCWGANNYGNLGTGTTTGPDTCTLLTMMIGGQSCAFHPVSVSQISTAKDVAVGMYASCAVLADSTVRCWGRNYMGALGNNATTDSALPVAVQGLANAQAIEGGFGYFMAVLTDGTVVSWGDDTNSDLGLGYGAPDTCWIGATCSQSPRPVSQTLYGGTDSLSTPDAGPISVPDAAGATSCSSTTPQGSCTVAAAQMCEEFAGYPSVAIALASCPASVGVWSTSPCATAGRVGGCRTAMPGLNACLTNWYYTGSSTGPAGCAGGWLTP